MRVLQQGRCNLKRQESWLLQRQMRLEGGFQGRTNKLVDSCYSFWQGAALAIVELIKGGGHDLSDVEGVEDTDQELNLEEGETVFDLGGAGNRLAAAKDDSGDLPFNQRALQQYILHCAQEFEKGGLKGSFL